jgi:uncharacterized protein
VSFTDPPERRVPTGDYRPPRWLPGAHAQTIWPAVALRDPPPRYRREQVDTPDGDFVDFDHVDGDPATPLVVMFHGLEGSSRSHYAAGLMRTLKAAGRRGVVAHFRGCGGTPNRTRRAYHSGDADEIDWVVTTLRSRERVPLHVAGVSLGANALLKWLAREGPAAADVVAAAVAVGAPLDLNAAGAALRTGFNRFYTREFLRTLRPKTLAKLDRWPDLFDATAMRAATTFDVFDDLYTGPVHGYSGVVDYWTRASSKPDLPRISVPTLVLNARNDPFLPARHLPRIDEVSRHVTLEQPEAGGHIGFVQGPFPGHVRWLPERILRFLEASAA